ncbi:MAG: DUF4377 domain-containing protein [Myxococcaceae bacterium]
MQRTSLLSLLALLLAPNVTLARSAPSEGSATGPFCHSPTLLRPPSDRALASIRERPSVVMAGSTMRAMRTLLAAAGPSLEHTRWGLIESQLAVPPPAADRDRVRLEFTVDRLSANSGCNTGAAGYRVEADSTLVLTTPIAMTMMACVDEAASYESAFFSLLRSRPKLSRDSNGEVLVLQATESSPGRHGLLRLRSQPIPSAGARQRLLYVAAKKAACAGVAPRECLQVRERPNEPWQLFYGDIVGFKYEPGIEYRLRILEDDVPNPPADGASKRWFLDLVIEQKVAGPNE